MGKGRPGGGRAGRDAERCDLALEDLVGQWNRGRGQTHSPCEGLRDRLIVPVADGETWEGFLEDSTIECSGGNTGFTSQMRLCSSLSQKAL